jgi:aminoglycoside 6'-N-acetyltransferase I
LAQAICDLAVCEDHLVQADKQPTRKTLAAYPVWMEHLVVRPAVLENIPEVASMCHCLWPIANVAEHAKELTALLAGNFPANLAVTVLVAQELGGRLVGFIEVDLRSHADGCDPSRPVAYNRGMVCHAYIQAQTSGRKAR